MRAGLALLISCGLIGCASTDPNTGVGGKSQLIATDAIEAATDGRCFTKTAGPRQTRIVTELVEVIPAQKDRNGVVTSPAVFRNVTRPVTETVGEGTRFETLCPQGYTTELVSTLQRALIVRRAYTGEVTGTYDAATQSAVQAFQQPMGIDSPYLAVTVARQLGIVAIPVDP